MNEIETSQALKNMLEATSVHDNRDFSLMIVKLGEEFGEFCESALFHTGNSRHKELKETPFGEAADIVICVTAILQKLYPSIRPADIVLELTTKIVHKTDKYVRTLEAKK